jgi:hypothetical protein
MFSAYLRVDIFLSGMMKIHHPRRSISEQAPDMPFEDGASALATSS